MQAQQLGSVRQGLPHGRYPVRKRDGNAAFEHFWTIFHAATHDRQTHGLLYLGRNNAPEFFIRFNQQKMIGRLQFQPLAETRAQNRQRDALSPRRTKEAGNHLIQCEGGREWRVGFAGPHKNAASAPVLNPTLSRQLPVACANRVRMQVKAPCQLPRAGQALARGKVIPQNAENDLGHKLFADTDFAFAREPKLHGRLSYG